MDYISTRNKNLKVSSAFAIANGISTEGGLFVPEEIPALSAEDFEALKKLDYIGRAKAVLSKFLTDFTDSELEKCLNGAYKNTFDDDCPAPMAKLGDKTHILELWHGPTCAFKDLALQLLPYLMTVSAKKVSDGVKTVILVATSGDTGKAALEGFKDVENTEIIVFYPDPNRKLITDKRECKRNNPLIDSRRNFYGCRKRCKLCSDNRCFVFLPFDA